MTDRTPSEQDIITKKILPAVTAPGKWDLYSQLEQEVTFTKGRITVRGKTVKRGKTKRADIILYYRPNRPIALIEAKDGEHSVGAGMQQGLEYAKILDIPFVYSSNGSGFLEHDRTKSSGPIERDLALGEFPSPDELWRRFLDSSNAVDNRQELIMTQNYYDDGSGKSPRYYQRVAINRTVDAIAAGQNRLLLVMATGTGKTYTAFQIIWRLWKSGAKKRILFLVDRNILADQTKTNDFKPFGSALTKITNREVNKAFEVYIALYQAITGTEEKQDIFKEFSPDFFDLIVVDECHRGSAAADASWHRVLDYFTTATQIGLTATPRETDEISNIAYFGEPIYTYSLRQGIDDGFLAPYKVIRVGLDKDLDGWRPEKGQLDRYGNVIEDREYNLKDFDKKIVLTQRDVAVAKRITQYLKELNPYAKTIVFCENIDHAERMRQALVNENAEHVQLDERYIMRITGDNDEGKAQLDNFIDPESTYPVIATTSKLMSTGVDAQTCQLIVLDQSIESATEFKQIIGRGTRLREDYNKFYFTIMDFRKATKQFADPDFDGPPEQAAIWTAEADAPEIVDAQSITGHESYDDEDSEVVYEEPDPSDIGMATAAEPFTKYVVDNVTVKVATERVQYLDAHGKLITESLIDYSRRNITGSYSSLTAFISAWNSADRKQAIIEELNEQGVFIEELARLSKLEDCDAFDLICHVAYNQTPLTRQERANKVRKRDVFGRYGEQARKVLEALLDKYAETGIGSVESVDILKVDPLRKMGTPIEIIKFFGNKEQYREALSALEAAIYDSVA